MTSVHVDGCHIDDKCMIRLIYFSQMRIDRYQNRYKYGIAACFCYIFCLWAKLLFSFSLSLAICKRAYICFQFLLQLNPLNGNE